MEMSDALRGLPQVDRLIETVGGSEPHALKAAAARRVVAEARAAVREGAAVPSLAAALGWIAAHPHELPGACRPT